MEQKRESIFRASIRNFFVGFFAVWGVFVAFVAIILVYAILAEETETYDAKMKATVVPDAKGHIAQLDKTVPVILQIDIKGVIGLDKLTMDNVRRQIIESNYGDLKGRVKGIFLAIESPGGTVIDSDGIYRDLISYKEEFKVPIYAHIDGICASGAFFVAVAADKIYATDASLIGSVGVLLPTFLNFSKLLTQYGIETKSITAGIGKDEMNPLRPWAPDESKNLKEIVEFYYQDFINIVTSHRPHLDKEKLVSVYGARIFPAQEAQGYGYIDASKKTRNETLLELTQVAGISDKSYQVVRLDSQEWFNELFKSQYKLLFQGKIEHHLVIPGALDPRLEGKLLYLYHPSVQ